MVLDNSPARVLEYSRAGVNTRTITLANFGDTEDIHWISGNTFVISQEKNGALIDEIVVIDLPTSGTTVDISTATRRLRPTYGSTITGSDNGGIEAVALLSGNFYFTTEKSPATPSGEWSVWKVANTGSGIQTPAATRAFRIGPIISGKAADISGMATDGTYLWLISHELAAANWYGHVFKVTLKGQVVEENTLPTFTSGDFWRQPEGIEIFTDTDGKVKIALSGEIGCTGCGVDFMLLSPP